MKDFEDEFMKKVRGEGEVVPEPKKSGKKRWLIVGGIGALLIGAIIAGVVIIGGAVEEAENEINTVNYEGSLIGKWDCLGEEGAEATIEFRDNSQFVWDDKDLAVRREGRYEWDGESLKMSVVSYTEDGYEDETGVEEGEWIEEYYVLEEDGTIFLEEAYEFSLFECERIRE